MDYQSDNTKGYIKIFHSLLDWEWYHDTNTFRVFIHLLLKANTRSKNWGGMKIKRGELVTSRSKLAIETDLSEREVRTALAHLVQTNEIAIKTTNRFTIITICKYGSYQGEEITNDQQATNKTTNKRANETTSSKPHKQRGLVETATNETANETTSETTTTIYNNIYNINTFSNEKVSSPEGDLSVMGENLVEDVEFLEVDESGNDKKEKEKSCAKKEKEIKKPKGEIKSPTLVGKARKIFEDYYDKQYGNSYYWTAKDGANMKQLLQKFAFSREKKGKSNDDEGLLFALEKFLEASTAKNWIADNFSVSVLNSQYNSIVSEYKNKFKQNTNGRTDTPWGSSPSYEERQDAVHELLKKKLGKNLPPRECNNPTQELLRGAFDETVEHVQPVETN